MTIKKRQSADTFRWTIQRKAEVVRAVRNGLLGLDEACERYRLSAEEFLHWEQLIAAHGQRGLKATRLRLYRQPEREKNTAQKPTSAQSGPNAPISGHPCLNINRFAGD